MARGWIETVIHWYEDQGMIKLTTKETVKSNQIIYGCLLCFKVGGGDDFAHIVLQIIIKH